MVDKIAFILIENRFILSTRSKGKDVFYIPGGKREHGETDVQTLIREVKEELTVVIKPESIRYLETFTAQSHGEKQGVLVQMTCYTASYAGELIPSSEIEEIRWLNSSDTDLISPVDKKIFTFLKRNGLID
jgi:8-oxo-dGTP pyrophosphatase MutT (NUDIX family)